MSWNGSGCIETPLTISSIRGFPKDTFSARTCSIGFRQASGSFGQCLQLDYKGRVSRTGV
jgi:hypothetical protein